MLTSVEKNLRDEIFKYIENNSIVLKAVDLNLLCLTANITCLYEESIVHYDYNNYKDAINTLTYTTDIVEYY